MATKVPLRMREGNDETITFMITPDDPADSLAGVTEVRVWLKPDSCTDDDALGVLMLSSSNPSQVQLTEQTTTRIAGLAFVPGSALLGSYDRVWRADAHDGTPYRTALFGPVTVDDL